MSGQPLTDAEIDSIVSLCWEQLQPSLDGASEVEETIRRALHRAARAGWDVAENARIRRADHDGAGK